MNHRYGFRFRLAIIAILLAVSSAAVQAKTWTKELAPGVTYIQIVRTAEDGGIPRIINAVKVDPRVPGVEIRSVLGNDRVNDLDPTRGREDMGSIAKRLKAIVVVNSDFCNWTGDPLGLHVEKGELVSEPYPRRTMFGITADGKHLFDVLGWDAKVTLPDGTSRAISGIDRDRGPGELIAYTLKWYPSTCAKDNGSEAVITTRDLPVRLGVPIKGRVTKLRPDLGDTQIPADGIVLSGSGQSGDFIENTLKEGMEVTLQFNVVPTDTTGWDKVVEAAGGTPRLLRNGEICTGFTDEGVGEGFVTTSHPRSALGTTADGRLVLATVDGRQYNATGMPLPDLARLMKQLGCVDALNLDGGGSSTMATWFGTLNSPSDGKLRALPNGIAVFAPEAPAIPVPEFTVSAPADRIVTGESMQLSLIDAATGEPLKRHIANRAIWSTAEARGFVDQSGKFTGYGVGKVEVVVKLGTRIARTTIDTVAGPPQKLLAAFTADKENPDKGVIAITVTDKNWNGLKGVSVRAKITGGKLDATDIATGDAGKVSIGVTWDGPSGGEVEVTCGDLKPVVVKRSSQ